ncbi:PLP-dependent aminotransferase family protein [Oceanospirillum sanctuarii]|uniref:aminotransferase-like domain-containing protein n=1 Tax=Oceanospirillum sanctuarii TaxID=1434821 RepID=UPI000A3D4C8A|nr:PLP-dependent aminotransferase family protein [Oceanospirillum sanctuarii]
MTKFRYLSLADQFIRQLREGRYSADEKLPSIRQISQDLNVSKGTAIRCYEYLEDHGWVEAREKSGFFPGRKALEQLTASSAQHAHQPSAEALAAISPKRLDNKSLGLEIVRSAGRTDQIPLGTANPCVSFPGVKRLYQLLKKEVGKEELALTDGFISHYQTPPGAEKLRKQLSQLLLKRDLHCTPDQIITTNGAQAAVSLALQATSQEGDIVLIESPCFYGILQCLEAFDRKVVEIPQATSGGPNLDLVAAALDKWPVKAIIVQPTLNNPTGKSMSQENRQRLIDLANQHDIAIIEDDIFADLDYRGSAPSPLKAIDTQDRVLYCSSISKTVTPKLRLGWLVAGRWHERCQHLQFVSKMGLPAHTQNALGSWLEAGLMQRHLRLIRRRYQQRQQLFQQAMQAYWPEGIEYEVAEGGFLAWIKFPKQCDAMTLYQQAQQEKINITPGPLFGSAKANRHFIRINFGLYQDQPEYRQAMQRLGELIRQAMAS